MDTGKLIQWLARQFRKLSAPLAILRITVTRDRAIAQHFDNHETDASGPSLDFQVMQREAGGNLSFEGFKAVVEQALAKGSIFVLSNHYFSASWKPGDEDFALSGEDYDRQFIENLVLTNGSEVPKYVFSGLRIYNVRICQNHHVTFENCQLGTVLLDGGNDGANVSFMDCRIRELKLSENCARMLHLKDTTVLGVTCPPAGTRNPFLGSAKFENAVFSTDEKVRSDVQQYRNLRHHLMSLQDLDAAGLVQRVVLIAERELSPSKWYRFFSRGYEGLSDFGNSVARPLGWWAFGLAGTILLIFFLDGSTLHQDLKLPEGSWHNNLIQPGNLGEFYRAAILALDAWTGPFGVIFGQDVVAAKTVLASILTTIARLLSTTLFALFILALRRKFRMS